MRTLYVAALVLLVGAGVPGCALRRGGSGPGARPTVAALRSKVAIGMAERDAFAALFPKMVQHDPGWASRRNEDSARYDVPGSDAVLSVLVRGGRVTTLLTMPYLPREEQIRRVRARVRPGMSLVEVLSIAGSAPGSSIVQGGSGPVYEKLDYRGATVNLQDDRVVSVE